MKKKYTNSPYIEIPTELVSGYTMDNKIPIFEWWFDDSKVLEMKTWNDEYITSFIERFTVEKIKTNRHLPEPYYNASLFIIQAIEKYGINNKSVAVLGTISPWIEGILLNFNNRVTTIEYNIPELETNKLKVCKYSEFVKGQTKYDCIISYSSIEHSGLGRYGDTLDPDGDIVTMKHIHHKLNDNGLLFLGVPIGSDAFVWNAHRVYGRIRLPLLISKFIDVEWIGGDISLFDAELMNNGRQPLIILKK